MALTAADAKGNFDKAARTMIYDMENANRKKFYLARGQGRRQNRLAELCLWKKSCPAVLLSRCFVTSKQLHLEILATLYLSVIKFMMCEFNKGIYDPKIAIFFLASHDF